MALISNKTAKAFDGTVIKKGDFIRAKYTKWQNFQNGIVASVENNAIRILYLTEVGNVSNFFTIYADEVEKGLWVIKYSRDLSTVATEGSTNADA